MAKPEYQRLPEEEQRNINQITDPEVARLVAEVEKPIRDLARDPEADQRISELKPLLDVEANRLATIESQTSEKKLLSQSINVIDLSTPNMTTRLGAALAKYHIE